jgi:hypothetical protein
MEADNDAGAVSTYMQAGGQYGPGIGTELIPTEAIQRRQPKRIMELAHRFARLVKDAREQIEIWKKSQVVKTYTGQEKCEP